MTRPEDTLVQWLRDAHAMEDQAETLLERETQRLRGYPELASGLARHLEETRDHARKLRECIDSRNGGTSALKDAAARLTAIGQALSGMFAGDEVVKAALALTTFEHMEITSYRILIAAAEEVGDNEIREVCETILREEEAMAAWLDGQLAPLARGYLSREMSAPERR